MSITLNHTIVPARNKEASAKHFAQIMGLNYGGQMGPFAQVRINDTLTFDFDDRGGDHVNWHHYAFHVGDEEFDAIFERIKAAGIKYGSAPWSLEDGEINHWRGGRGVYFRDLDGHILELLTRS